MYLFSDSNFLIYFSTLIFSTLVFWYILDKFLLESFVKRTSEDEKSQWIKF